MMRAERRRPAPRPALSALAALGCGLAAAQGDFVFVALFGAASIVTIIEVVQEPSLPVLGCLGKWASGE
jgi:hypothetical protein